MRKKNGLNLVNELFTLEKKDCIRQSLTTETHADRVRTERSTTTLLCTKCRKVEEKKCHFFLSLCIFCYSC